MFAFSKMSGKSFITSFTKVKLDSFMFFLSKAASDKVSREAVRTFQRIADGLFSGNHLTSREGLRLTSFGDFGTAPEQNAVS